MTQSAEPGTIWLTQEAYDKLQAELEDLKGPVRQEIIETISAARDEGDLKENGGYHAAKDEQGKQEARIRQLEDMLRRAEVGETPADDGIVEPGMVVTYSSPATTATSETFLLGAREIGGRHASTSTPRSPRSAPPSTAEEGRHRHLHRAQRQDPQVEIIDAVPYKAEPPSERARRHPRTRRLGALPTARPVHRNLRERPTRRAVLARPTWPTVQRRWRQLRHS